MEIEKATAKPRRTVWKRVLWFLVGAGMNYLLISIPFKYLAQHTDLPTWAIAACSLAVSTSFFFPWNYFVNFRTDSRKRDAFPRYLAAVLIMYVISTTLLSSFKSFKGGFVFHGLDLDIVTMQLCLGWVKFIVYHKWAFPESREKAALLAETAAIPPEPSEPIGRK